MKWLPTNPVPMQGKLSRCWLMAYRAPLEEVGALLPPELKPVRFGDYGFWNVLVCEVQHMRPRGIPAPIGVTYRHVAYRIYARYHGQKDSAEGLYFLRSDCDAPLLAKVGNAITAFRFHTGEVDLHESPIATRLEVRSAGACGCAVVHYGRTPILAPDSPFDSLEEANSFLTYPPSGLSVNGRGVEAVPVQRTETEWKQSIVAVTQDHWDFLDGKNVKLEIAWEVEPIDYQWLRGRTLH